MTLVVFAFFIAYEFLVLKPQQEEKAKQEQIAKEQKQNSAPDVANVANAPAGQSQDDMNKSIQALSTKAIGSSNILTTIKTNRNIIEIDKLGRVAQVTLLDAKYKDENGDQIKLLKLIS